MTINTALRSQAFELFEAGVAAANPALALRAALQNEPLEANASGKLLIIAAGKAAILMMEEALTHLPEGQAYEALAVTNYENGAELSGSKVLVAGHPVPDENGAIAARKVLEILDNAGENDQVIALISGGASALLPAPAAEILLEDKITLNDILLRSGFNITELNLVRQQLSRLKGGGMTRHAAPAKVRGFILSDVIGDDIRVIASGPTATPIGNREEALQLLQSRKLAGKVPKSIIDYLSKSDDAQPIIEAENAIIGSNLISLEAIKRQALSQGWNAQILSDQLTMDVDEAARIIADSVNNVTVGKRHCLIFGGETSVQVKGDGLGGRNQELALRVAMYCQHLDFDWVFLSGGTDGRDGPTDAAGGIVDKETLQRLGRKNLDANAMLENSNSYYALEASADLIKMPATGTNVADVQIALVEA